MKRWFTHFIFWLRAFPRNDDMHLDIRGVSDKPGESDHEFTCWICGRTRPLDEDEE